MSKKPFIIIVSLALGLLLVGLVGYYFVIQNNNSGIETSSGFKNFFPFGGSENPAPTAGTTENPPETPEQANFTQKLRRLSSEPVAGAGTLDNKAGTIVRYIEKATGHIFEIELFSPVQNRISNTTLPLVVDAIWGGKNTALVARYLKDDNQTVDTYSLLLKSVSTTMASSTSPQAENIISGTALPPNIVDISVLGDSIFYLQKDSTGSTGYTSSFSSSKRVQIWKSPIKELLSQYVNQRTITLTTKPEKNIFGFLYSVDTANGQTKKILGDILGLSALMNPDASKVLYLENSSEANMYLFDVKTKIRTKITPTTFPEKCVWSKLDKNIIFCAVPEDYLDGNSLTSWYKGLSSFGDDIWKIDTKNNTSGLLENLFSSSDEQIDVIKPILSENERYLIFINKIDNSLWSLDLTK